MSPKFTIKVVTTFISALEQIKDLEFNHIFPTTEIFCIVENKIILKMPFL